MAGSITPNGAADPTTVFGNQRVVLGVMDAADGAGEAIATGLDQVASFSAMPASVNTSGGIKIAASGGDLTPASCTSGDTWVVTIIGK